MTRYKAFRLKNKKYRNAARKRNYHRNRPEIEKAKRRPTGVKSRTWSMAELEIFFLYEGMNKITDRELAKMLNRSVQAIQQKRYLFKKDSNGKSTD